MRCNRVQLLKNFRPRLKKDGLNNLVYKKPLITLNVLYTNILVDIQKVPVDADYSSKKPKISPDLNLEKNVSKPLKIVTFNATSKRQRPLVVQRKQNV